MDPIDYKPRDWRWSQRDWKWSQKKVGISGRNIHDIGCAILSVNYLYNRAINAKGNTGKFSRPNVYIDWLNRAAAGANYKKYLTPSGQLYWNSMDEFSGNLITHQMHPLQVGERGYQLMEVQWGTLRHWVALLDGDLCLDPWTAQIIKREQPYWYETGRRQYYKLNA